MLKLRTTAFLAVLFCTATAPAQVIPGREGIYVGSVSGTLSSFSVQKGQKLKENVMFILAPDGQFLMVGDTINFYGHAGANTYHGVAVLENGSGFMPLHFASNGSIKGSISMGMLIPNSAEGLMIEGKMKLKKTEPAPPEEPNAK